MIHTPATVLLGSGFFHRSHDLRSPWATDTLDFWYYWHSRVQHCYCCRYSLSYHWVIAADKQWGSSCCHTLTHVHMQHLTWKERKLCGTGSLAAADGLRYSRSAETAVCPSGATSGTAEKVHKWSENLANHKSSHCPSVTPRSRVFFFFLFIFHHTENSWPYSVNTSTQWSDTRTHLSMHWLVHQFAFGMWERGGGGNRDDQFKNTHEQWKSTGVFCDQVHGKVI